MNKEVVITKALEWRDIYKTRLDQDLTNAFPHLELRLREAVANNWKLMIKGKSKEFSQEILLPEITGWVDQNVIPIIHEAAEKLAEIETLAIDIKTPQHQVPTIINGGDLPTFFGQEVDYVNDVGVPATSLILGVSAMTAGLVYGITTTTATTLWVITTTTTAISWPLIVGGLVIGGVLSAFGVVRLSKIKQILVDRFSLVFIPKIKDALIGNGYSEGGKKCPSLKRQLQDWVDEQAKHMEDKAK